MNKKVSTLLTVALTLGGSLLSTSAFAQAYNADAAARVQSVSKLVEGRAYYIGQQGTAEQLSTSDNFLSITKDATTKVLTVGNVAVSSNGEIPEITAAGAWFVTKDSDGNLKFTNDNGVTLGFAADGSFTSGTTTTDNIKSTLFYPSTNGLKILKTTGSNYFLNIAASNSLTLESTEKNIVFFEAKDNDVTFSDFQSTVGDNFSLNFGTDGLKGDSIFTNLTVVKVNQNSNTAYSANLSTDDEQFYLMCDGEVADDHTFDLATANTKEIANFEKAKFVVLSTTRLAGSQFANDANGYKYTVMTGKELNEAVKKTTDAFDADNAKFTAHKSYNQSDESYILRQTGVTVSSAAEDVNVWLDSVAEGSVNYVASNIDDVHKTPVEIVAGKGTRVDVKTIATGRRIVNVLIQNSNKEFSNALTLDEDGTATADLKKSESGFNYPMGQWLISADKNANTITLVNLQNTSKVEDNIALYETEKAGEYKVVDASGTLDDKVIKFQNVTSDEYNGYANFDDTELAGKTFKLKVKKTTVFGTEVEAYLQANAANVKYVLTADEATNWTLSKKTTDDVVDTLKVYAPAYNYYGTDGKLVEVKANNDVLTNVFTYTFKADKNASSNQTSDGDKLYLSSTFTAANSEGNIVIRQVALNTYKLLASGTINAAALNTVGNYAKEDNEKIATGATTMTDALNFELVTEEPAPSLAADSKHVTFSINGLNYIAMDANGNGVVANETSTLKAATVEDFTFWIDSVDAEAVTPSFFISKGDKMMVNGSYVVEAAQTAFENDEITEDDKDAIVEAAKYNNNLRVKFTAAARAEGDTLMINNEKVVNDAFKFNIVEAEDGGYVLKNGMNYVGAVNEQLVMTDKANAVVVEVATAEAPTSNEGVSASEVAVVAQNGSVVVKNAAGKNVVVSTILGQVVANEVLTSDNATINVPAGIVVVAVEGESFKVNVK